ncbi:hypothetical protein [Actinacidiphila paucisporea]|uniref:hypothetical protein n=1 Tax=Actinacidiphila paucisporea TaxID=310782 RepID=UPI00190E635A|nr:hypothetical protein [Actinacidiphila paucisporea]
MQTTLATSTAAKAVRPTALSLGTPAAWALPDSSATAATAGSRHGQGTMPKA